MDELVRRVPGAMEVISKLDGFKAYYVIKAGEDTLATSACSQTSGSGDVELSCGRVGQETPPTSSVVRLMP